ncbi:unnamed protein product [Mytilus coruscus]|uniref:CCHC-type domain-containing protein n=1 Tax=Mytilus coruscus TaxID=42192 RepID=A0A6J8EZ22_MYTCO|nr:unnamed protein product [Mytilus coruscus]
MLYSQYISFRLTIDVLQQIKQALITRKANVNISKMIFLILMVITLMSVATNSCPVDCYCSTSNVPVGQSVSCVSKGLDAIPSNLPNDTYKLNIEINQIAKIDNSVFGDNPLLQILKLGFNKLIKIEDTYFKNLRNLTYLNLDNNAIFFISNNAFEDLISLQTLDLYDNELRYLNSRLFSNLTNLQTLDVRYNEISQIEDYTFVNQNKVEILKLTGNCFTAITSNTFAGLKRVKKLYIGRISEEKKLVAYTFRDLPEISLIELENCGLVTIEKHAFYNLTGSLTLNIRSNSIVEIQSKAFAGLTGVEKIDLEYNKLKTIRADTFIDMPNLNLLNLKRNDILEIEENAFGDLPELLVLSLANNNLICSCKIRPFYLWLLKRSRTVVDGAICADKNGQLIKKLSNVDECTETTTLFDTSAATTNEVSTNIKTTVNQDANITTVNNDRQDQQETTTVFDMSAATTNEVSTNIETTINQVAMMITMANDQQDVYNTFSKQMRETTNSNERTVTFTSTKSYKNTIQTTYSTSEETSEDKPDTNIPFLQVTLLGVIACTLAAIALITIVIYILYRERCKEHKSMYESTTIENAGEVMDYDVLELPYVSTIHLIGGKTYALLRNLSTPEKPKEKSYENIVKVLKEHLSPAPLVLAERFRFHKRDQKSGESINEYVAQICKFSEYCNFPDLNDTLRDRLVCGLKSEQTQRKLLSIPGLTFEKAMQISVGMETATKEAMELQGKQPESAVHKVKSQKPKVSFHQQKIITCYRCNKQGHQADTCRLKDQTCHKCQKTGHIQAACRSKIIKRNVHSLNADDSQDDEFGIYTVFANKDTQKGNNDIGIYTVNSKTKEIPYSGFFSRV